MYEQVTGILMLAYVYLGVNQTNDAILECEQIRINANPDLLMLGHKS